MKKHAFITVKPCNDAMPDGRTDWIDYAINNAVSIHFLGSSLNPERPAHRAIHDLDGRGWRLVPIHPRDAGRCIMGRVIRREIEDGIVPDIVVLFLAPERAKAAILAMLMKYNSNEMPLIWLQHGAESDELTEMLEHNNLKHVKNDCIVEYITRNDIRRVPAIVDRPWFRQISDEDGSGCSVWEAFEPLAGGHDFSTELEWVGDLVDLELSEHAIARYIRSLVNPDEKLLDVARRLA